MKITYLFLVAGSLLSGGVLAMDNMPPNGGQCPTVDWLRQWFRHNTRIGDKTVFYTKPASNHDAKLFAEKVGGHYWGNLVNQELYFDWLGQCKDGKEQDLLTPRMAEAIALESHGTAYVMLEKVPDPKSIWVKVEKPALERNGVTIMKVRPGGGKPAPYGNGSPGPSPANSREGSPGCVGKRGEKMHGAACELPNHKGKHGGKHTGGEEEEHPGKTHTGKTHTGKTHTGKTGRKPKHGGKKTTHKKTSHSSRKPGRKSRKHSRQVTDI